MSAVRPSRRGLEGVIAQLRDELRRQRREVKQLCVEDEILREAAEPVIRQAPARERFVFVPARGGRFSVYRMCRFWRPTPATTAAGSGHGLAGPGESSTTISKLTRRIAGLHAAYPAYGAERVTRKIKRQGVVIGRRRVARLMREYGVKGVTRRRRRNPTKPGNGAAAVPDLIRRDFTAPMPGLKLTGDIGCLPTGEGRLHLVTVLDLCGKELIDMPSRRTCAPAWQPRRSPWRAAPARSPVTRSCIPIADRNTARRRTGTLYGAWRCAGAPAAPDRVSTALRPSLLRHDQGRDRRRLLARPGFRAPRHRDLDHPLQPAPPALRARLPDPELSPKRLAGTRVNGGIRKSSVPIPLPRRHRSPHR
jgi:HTH-like domain